MRLKAVWGAALLGTLVLSSSAWAYIARPTIGEHQAEKDVAQFLHKNYPGWRYRQYGYLDCRNGRLNRYTWACRVGWLSGNKCRQGRVRVTNEYAEEGVVYYLASSALRRC